MKLEDAKKALGKLPHPTRLQIQLVRAYDALFAAESAEGLALQERTKAQAKVLEITKALAAIKVEVTQ